jgi:hypothetical protein
VPQGVGRSAEAKAVMLRIIALAMLREGEW